MKKKKTIPNVDPEFIERHKASLIRKNRQVLYFNEKEIAAIDEYCRRFKISSKSSLYRQIIMEHILEQLDENHPTLF